MKNQITRRGFVSGATALAATTAAMSASSIAHAEESSATSDSSAFENTIDWNAEYDVVVLGSGFAGLAAALTAADNGAHVLLVEKGPRILSGGNSRFSMQNCVTCDAENRDAVIQYFEGTRGMYDSPDDETIEHFVDGIIEVPDWIRSLGGNPVIVKGVGGFTNIAGYDLVNLWNLDGKYWNAGLYHFLLKILDENENIDTWYGTPAKAFIQDPATKIVDGVTVENNGTEYNVRALNGVVLATGGFEANQWMTQNYIQLPYCYAKGSQLNTGDGILMAQAIGAQLWHMSHPAGPDLNYIDPETGRPPYFAFAGVVGAPGHSLAFCSDNSAIIVGADGSRFHNESVMPNNGLVDYHGYLLRMPESLPAYCVFDQNAFDTHQIYPSWIDNQAKVDDGTIQKFDTAAELDEALGFAEGALEATIQRYNGYCDAGEDIEFKRAAEYLVPLSEEGPYYAFEVKPSYTDTMGGPRHTADSSILDTNDNPIPHLYGAGECGSIWSDAYQGASNIAECLVFGRLAGAAAAAEKNDNLREAVDIAEAVDFTEPVPDPTEGVELGENQYIGTGTGIGVDPFAVRVTMDGDKITAVEVFNSGETPGIGSTAIDRLPQAIIDANSTEIDTIAGATNTSNGIINAVNEALASRK